MYMYIYIHIITYINIPITLHICYILDAMYYILYTSTCTLM